MANEVEILVTATDTASSVLSGVGSALGGIATAAIAAGAALTALVTAGLVSSVKSAVESQDAIANLEATLKSTGGAVGLTSAELQKMASEFQNVTRFSDETILNGEAMLLTFTSIGKDIFPQATEAMLNLSQKMGGDVSGAAIQLGKALNDPIGGVTALRRVGVQFNDEQEKMIKGMVESGDLMGAQTLILKELETEFGGLAVAMGDTFAGKIEILKNRFDEIKEGIGNALIPILEILLDKFIQFLPTIELWGQKIASFITALGQGNFGPFTEFINMMRADLVPLVQEYLPRLVLAFNQLKATLGPQFGELFKMSLQWLVDNQDSIVRAIEQMLNMIGLFLQGLNNLAKILYPVFVAVADISGKIFTVLLDIFNMDWGKLGADIANSFITAVKRIFGIASPSTVFAEIARELVLGFIQGWQNTFGLFLTILQGSVGQIISLVKPALNLLGFDIGATSGTVGGRTSIISTGTVGGRSTDTIGGGISTAGKGPVNNYYYGPVYFGAAGEPGAYYDCPSPNPLIAATSPGVTGGRVMVR